MKMILLIIIILLFTSCSNENLNDNNQLTIDESIDFDLGISFPPVADEEQRIFTAPLLNELNVNSIRIGEDWSFREPFEGQFNWEPLDERINWAENNGIDLLLTIQSNGPDWACGVGFPKNRTVVNSNLLTLNSNCHNENKQV